MAQQQRTRNQQRQQAQHDNGPGSDSADALDSVRATADRLFAVADRAYDRVRAQDSVAHLRANRQTGGQ